MGRPLQSLFAPSEFLLPAGAFGSILPEHESGAGVTVGFSVAAVRPGVMPVRCGEPMEQQQAEMPDAFRPARPVRPALFVILAEVDG